MSHCARFSVHDAVAYRVQEKQAGDRMPRFFLEAAQFRGSQAVITGGDARHIARVLRMGIGDGLTLCDGAGMDYAGVIRQVEKDRLLVEIVDKHPSMSEPQLRVTLFQGLPKASKMDTVIEKCTELGVSQVVPVQTERAVVRLEDEKARAAKVARWRKIAEAAAKQSGRGMVPVVSDVCRVSDMLPLFSELDAVVVPYENEQETHLAEALSRMESPGSIGVVIGPEGGLAREEVDAMLERGAVSVSLGARILRTETAGAAVLAALMYAFGEM